MIDPQVKALADKLGYKVGRTVDGILDRYGRFTPVPDNYFIDSKDIPKVTMKVVSIDYENRSVTFDSEV